MAIVDSLRGKLLSARVAALRRTRSRSAARDNEIIVMICKCCEASTGRDRAVNSFNEVFSARSPPDGQ